ncbi:MAG: hypothetical protein LBP59_09330 [Planctomycetaceae bacterium]|nr:hypothetical protein [Planctomycetaceae bacterium]
MLRKLSRWGSFSQVRRRNACIPGSRMSRLHSFNPSLKNISNLRNLWIAFKKIHRLHRLKRLF